ncbi:MAG: glycosyltransferase family 2 protein [Lachnospiraceae bacterium]|nr:glycosyltransferase family 2 protein [Lachnospiraceae bacterium]
MKKKVGIILVNYNGEKYIVDCINSLLEQTYKKIEILFWDNHSDDASVKIVNQMYPQIHLVEGEYNYGFAEANNLAVKKILKMGVEYVLLLNIDTVADPHLVEYLLEKADANIVTTAQICTGMHGEKSWYAGGELQLDIGKSRHLNIKRVNMAIQVTFISGCCMMIHKDIIKKYGLFDTKYYLYYEDTDLCMRWYLKGVHMYYLPKAKLWHRIGGSSGGIRNPLKEYYMIRNRLYFVKKYRRYLKINILKILWMIIKEEVLCPPEYDRRMIKAVCLGIRDFYMGKMCEAEHNL